MDLRDCSENLQLQIDEGENQGNHDVVDKLRVELNRTEARLLAKNAERAARQKKITTQSSTSSANGKGVKSKKK